MLKELIVSSSPHETKLAVLEDDQLAEVYFERPQERTIAGSIFKGKVKRVLPGMQSAFVDIGLERDAFLYVTDFIEDTEEYDKVVTAAEDKVARLERESRPRVELPPRAEAPRAAEREVREPRAPAAPPPDVAPEEAAAPPEGPAAEETRPGGEPRDHDRGRRRRSRRRRFRDRGFPESKYASRTEVSTAAETRAPSVVQDAPDTDFSPIVLPGESLAKYRLLSKAQPDSSASEARGAEEAEGPEAASHLASASGATLDESETDEGETAQAESAGEARAELHRQVVTATRQMREDSGVLEEEQRRLAAEPEAGELPAAQRREASREGGETVIESAPPALETLAEPAVREAEGPPLPAQRPGEPELLEDERQAQLRPFSSPSLELEEQARVPVAGADNVIEREDTAAQVRERPQEFAEAPSTTENGGEEVSRDSEQADTSPAAVATAEAGGETPDEGEEAPAAAPGEEEPAEKAAVRGPAEQARFTNRMSRRTRRKMREQQFRTERRERVERERADRGERVETRPERPERSERPERAEPARREDGQPLISDLLREGQEIIVQIAKEPLGRKGARITSHVALPGRYIVYMPTVEHIGVSRKIGSDEERLRLKRIMIENRKNISGGFIVRTAAEGRSEEELKQDIQFLHQLWMDMRARAERKPAPVLLHHDLNLVERILRDQLSEDFRAIWVDNEQEYEKILNFVQNFQPNLVGRVKLYTKSTPIFEEFGVQEEINRSLKPKVWLKSGGYIVINQTEALVAIDINTGKYVGKTQRLEDTIVKTNVDAIREIVRQVRLRDLGGIIVIDFIDMDERKNRIRVMQALEEALRGDRAPSKVLAFNDFGLVAITRKRVKQSLERTLCEPCFYCSGAGYLKSAHTVAMEILAESSKLELSRERKDLTLRVHPEVARYLKQRDVTVLQDIEDLTRRTVIVKSDAHLHVESFDFN